MAFTDTELMMLEQMTYVGGDACKLAGVTATQVEGETIGERLSVFDEDALKTLEKSGEEGQQWAAIIRYIQGDKELSSLKQGETFRDENNRILATAYTDSNGKAYVTFNGTATPENWYDNGTGLGTGDTKTQKEALEYINALPYDNLTVVGHSKGGNLAQYVTITSGKVDRCVSMDGQGFSQEFLEKYWAEIELNGGKITNYSLNGDFVHILLYPVPGAKQDYCQGDRVDGIVQNHYANSFFQYDTVEDENGNKITVIRVDGNDAPVIINGQEENAMMTYLHQFTCFVLSTMPQEDRIKMGDYVGNILKLAMTKKPVEANGKIYTDLIEYVLSDQENFAKVIAYLIKYMETYNLTEEEVRQLMEWLGMGFLVQALDEFYLEHKEICDIAIGSGESILMFFLKNITDGKEDKLIEKILGWLSNWLNETIGGLINVDLNLDWQQTWQNIEDEYTDIPTVSSGANQNISTRVGRKFRYTNEVYDALSNAIETLSHMGDIDVSQWNVYNQQPWFTKLFINAFVKGINKYNSKLNEINATAKTRMVETFEDIEKLDVEYAEKVAEQISNINILKYALDA